MFRKTNERQDGPRRVLGTMGVAIALAGSLTGAVLASGNNSVVALLTSTDGKVVYGQAISRNGQYVTGVIDNASHDAHGSEVYKAFRMINGKATVIPVPGSTDPTLTSFGEGVNDSGDVVGEFNSSDSPYPRAFLAHGTTITNLNDVLGANFSQARAINNNGVIAGFASWPDMYGGFILKPDQTVIRIPNVYISAMNSANHVVGVLNDNNGAHPFFFADANNDGQVQDGEVHLLGTLGGADTLSTSNGPLEINDSDKIVGSLLPANSTTQHAIAWNNGDVNATANDLLPTATRFSVVYGINNSGHMVGYADGSPFYSANGSLADANAINLSRIVSEGKTPAYQVYTAHKISNTDVILAEAAPNQVPPAVGVVISINGNSTPPPPAANLTKVEVASTNVTLPDPISVKLSFSAKITKGISVTLVFVSDSNLGTLKQTYTVTKTSGTANQATLSFSGFSHVTAPTHVIVSGYIGTLNSPGTLVTGPTVTVSPAPVPLKAAAFSANSTTFPKKALPFTVQAGQPIFVRATFSKAIPAAGAVVNVVGLKNGTTGEQVTVHPDNGTPTVGTFSVSTSEVVSTLTVHLQVKDSSKSFTSPAITITAGTTTALDITAVSLAPTHFQKTIDPNTLVFTVTFNRPLQASDAEASGANAGFVVLSGTVSVPGLGDIPFPIKLQPGVDNTSPTVYTVTAAKLSEFSSDLALAPAGTYNGTVKYKSGTVKPFQFTIDP